MKKSVIKNRILKAMPLPKDHITLVSKVLALEEDKRVKTVNLRYLLNFRCYSSVLLLEKFNNIKEFRTYLKKHKLIPQKRRRNSSENGVIKKEDGAFGRGYELNFPLADLYVKFFYVGKRVL